MKKIPLLVLAGALVFTRAEFSIDDRDSRFTFGGSNPWESFTDSSYYAGTATDNACVTSDGCYFTVSFTGSGIRLIRQNIYSIAIPLSANVALDGVSRTGIANGSPSSSAAEEVYSLQGLDYGAHVLRVDLVSYSSGVASHFRVDRAIIDDTRPPASTIVTTATARTTYIAITTTTSSISGSQSPRASSPPAIGRVTTKKTPMGSIVGGTIAGLAVLSIALVLFIFLRRRTRAPRRFGETEKVDTQNLIYAPLDLPRDMNTSATQPMASGTRPMPPPPAHFQTSGPYSSSFDQFPSAGPYMPPFDRFPPEVQDDSGGNGRIGFNTFMAVSPLPTERLANPPIHALDIFPGPSISGITPQGRHTPTTQPMGFNTGVSSPPPDHFHNSGPYPSSFDQNPSAEPYVPTLDHFSPEVQDKSGGDGRIGFNTFTAVPSPPGERLASPPIHAPESFPGPSTSSKMMPDPYPASSSSGYPSDSKAPRDTQSISITDTTDADSTLPRSISPSIVSSTAPFVPRIARPLRDDEVQTAAGLLRQGLPTNDVTRILEAMRRGEEDSASVVLSHASTSASAADVGGERFNALSNVAGPSNAGQQLTSGPRDSAQPPPYHLP